MSKADIIKKAATTEEKLMLSHMYDLYVKSDRINQPAFSDFLTPFECRRVEECFYGESLVSFFGGYDDAERKIAVFGQFDPDYHTYPLVKLRIHSKNKEVSGHRDYLGSILSLGIDRSRIGDIVIFDTYAIVFCMEDMADYIIYNLKKVNNNNVIIEPYYEELVFDDNKRFKEEDFTVSSLRLDCVVSAFTKKSRTMASEFIREKRVFLNYAIGENPSQKISSGDVISVRGIGKGKIYTDNILTKKGRIHIKIKYYI